MQLALNEAEGRLSALFARGPERDYLVRSEKRPGPRPGGRPPRRRNRRQKRRLSIPYACLTLLALLALYPLGLILLWVRKIPWQWTTKMGVTLVFAMASVVLISFALTVPVEDARLQGAQARGRAALADAGTRMAEGWARSEITPERIWQDAQDIAGHGVQAAQSAVTRALPAWIERSGGAGEGAVEVARNLGELARSGAVQLMYKANLIPTPEPTAAPTPEPTAMPTPEPTAVPTPEPTAVPTAMPADEGLVAWRVGDQRTYHLDAACPRIAGAAASMSLLDAVSEGLMPCELCANPDEIVRPEDTPRPEPTAAPAGVRGLPSMSPSPSPDPSAAARAAVPSPSPTPTPMPTASPTPVPLPSIKPAGDVVVYYQNGSKYYHATENCGSMTGAPARAFRDAVAAGKIPCPYGCKGKVPEQGALGIEDAVWVDEGGVFHITDECEGIDGATALMPLRQAMLEDGDEGCAQCGAALYVKAAKIAPANTPIPAPAT